MPSILSFMKLAGPTPAPTIASPRVPTGSTTMVMPTGNSRPVGGPKPGGTRPFEVTQSRPAFGPPPAPAPAAPAVPPAGGGGLLQKLLLGGLGTAGGIGLGAGLRHGLGSSPAAPPENPSPMQAEESEAEGDAEADPLDGDHSAREELGLPPPTADGAKEACDLAFLGFHLLEQCQDPEEPFRKAANAGIPATTVHQANVLAHAAPTLCGMLARCRQEGVPPVDAMRLLKVAAARLPVLQAEIQAVAGLV